MIQRKVYEGTERFKRRRSPGEILAVVCVEVKDKIRDK
jgi:hypothetical protein